MEKLREGGGGQWGGEEAERAPAVEVEPDFGLSGALAAEANTVAGVTLVYNEPPEARKPSAAWRLYCFKGEAEACPPLPLHSRSCWLLGRERRVVDIATEHPSCSKQHAVLQCSPKPLKYKPFLRIKHT